ncbi:hypothetical protein, partial [Klebsiella pneumoniae]|uniref:hypothetical protein n=4 Tax=Klebsiella/Raoultella group TaxID=2890311 RepID=UPI001966AB8F
RITPSVAEQEGQQTETEATGAPQKHHYTLNQQVGSITAWVCSLSCPANLKLGISKPFGYRFTARMLDWCKLPPDGT